MSKLVRRFYPWACKIVAVSQGVADDLIQITKLPLSRIQVIYNPVVAPELREKAKEPVAIPWFAATNDPVILSVGRLTELKDFPTLIRAFALVRRKLPCRLLILGEGDQRASLEGLVSRLGLEEHVLLPGFASNPYSYMAQAAVFVLSSISEGLPSALIEAMAVGTPVVSTACPSGPSEIITPEVNGLLVPSADPEALAEAILRVLENKELARKLSQAGKLRAMDFCVEKIVKEYDALFKSLLAR
jgi:glycosyltransferase involved in cell wall biosynthesis